MNAIPLDPDDVAPGRALRTFFARFWSTETGEPRDVYDRFVAATPTAAGVTVTQSAGLPGPGIWVRPVDANSEAALLFLHGGGYGLGSAGAYAGFVSQLVARVKMPAFVLDYPLAPEACLPTALELSVDTLHRLRSTYSAVAVAGDSAGGGLTLATVAEAVRHTGIDVAAAAVFSPWTDLSLSGASVRANAISDPLLDPEYLRRSAAAYLGDTPADDPRASPLFGTASDLPPVLIQVGTDEILLDDSIRYAAAAGPRVQLEIYQGMHHVFQLNVGQLATARRAVASAADFLAARLQERISA
ncbi:alpha/beta hydrolase fold domain-containing protein [Mycolicibacterium sp. 018/SC-01/001]|uniref:alpha/beta hydrolase fold domain-containing protein n=1 Tax=Mycolicibacterium sp. 018/SC-01/001 TaxID=2592069 RepID=UPI00163DD455|nr:alpha/beta hydrolase fold domain-containing protein [Mycolicibacterium sp. 018/SC-01/001]